MTVQSEPSEAMIEAGIEAFPGVIAAQYVKNIYLAMKQLDPDFVRTEKSEKVAK